MKYEWYFYFPHFKPDVIYFLDVATEGTNTPVLSGPLWPDLEEMQKMTFDINPRDPKFKQCSAVYSGRNTLPRPSGMTIKL